MIMNQKGKGNDNFQTPQFVFEQLNKIFNFTFDVACCTYNKLCEKGFFFDLGEDALKTPWGGGRTGFLQSSIFSKS